MRDEAAIDSLLGHLRDEFGPVDILVNNAGTIQVGPLEAMTMSDFEEAMKLHVFAPLRLTLGLRDGMRARGGGRVGNVSSIGGVVAVPHLLPYSASKFALVGLSRGLRAELAGDRIFVTTITPGLMRTGSPGGALFKGQNEKEYAWFAISDSMPLLSMSSRRAAHRIVRALERGEPNLVLGLPAKVAAVASGVAPGLVARTMALANGLLPRIAGGAGGAGGKGSVDERARARKGSASASRLVPSILTRLSGRAAARNNEPPLAARGADADAAPRP